MKRREVKKTEFRKRQAVKCHRRQLIYCHQIEARKTRRHTAHIREALSRTEKKQAASRQIARHPIVSHQKEYMTDFGLVGSAMERLVSPFLASAGIIRLIIAQGSQPADFGRAA